MNVLEINLEKTWRGGERQTLFNAIGLRNEGANVSILCRKNSAMAQKASENEFNTIQISNPLLIFLYLIFNGYKFNIIHVQSAKALTFAALTKWAYKAKIVFTRRVIFQPKGKLTLFKYKKADALVAISSPVKDIIEKFTNTKATLISDAIEEIKPNELRAKQYISQFPNINNKKIILTVAAITSDKEPLTLAKAINELKKTRTDFLLLHLGDGNLRPSLEAYICENNLQECYHIAGFTNQVDDFFSVADVFTLSSKEEGLGSSVLDAFYHKVPCATTNSGGLQDLLENNRGLLCDISDFENLAKNINTLLDNPQNSNQLLTENAYKYVLENHTISQIGKKYIQLFNNLLSK